MRATLIFRSQLGRAVGFGVVAFALMASAGPSAGCLFPDYCISIGVTGTQMCVAFSNASGVDGGGELVDPLLDGVGFILGCDCLFDAEVEILAEGDPESVEHQEIMFRLETQARQRCLAVAVEQGLVETSCQTVAEIGNGIFQLPESCVAGCVFTNPPPGGKCSGECTSDDDAFGETGTSEGAETTTETGDEPPAGVRPHTEAAP